MQGLNEFHAKSKNLVHKITGCTLHCTKITIKDTSIPAIPLLFVAPNATFESYRHLIDNHIQSIINFYEVRSQCQKLSLSGVSCSFKGGSDGPQELQRFLLWRRNSSVSAIHAQLPITVKIRHRDPSPSLWKQVSESTRPLWNKYIRLRVLLDTCHASVHFKNMQLFHKRTLSFERVSSSKYIDAKTLFQGRRRIFSTLQ